MVFGASAWSRLRPPFDRMRTGWSPPCHGGDPLSPVDPPSAITPAVDLSSVTYCAHALSWRGHRRL